MNKKNNSNNKKIEILWSGGWDSTFMLCKFLKEGKTVQPYYICFGRSSEEHEKQAIQNVLEALKGHVVLKGRVLPIKFVKRDSIELPNWLVSVWKKYVGEPYSVSKQYLYLASFASKHKGIAIGQERYYETPGHLTKMMYEKGHMKFTADGVGYFDKKICDKDAYALFGNAVYPVCLYSELMMKDMAEELGFMDIMNQSWFCYHPIHGKPCGMCGPCRVKVKQHMDFLFEPYLLNASLVGNYLIDSRIKAHDGKFLYFVFESYIRNYRNPFGFNIKTKLFLNNYNHEVKLFEYMLKNPPIKHRSFCKNLLNQEQMKSSMMGEFVSEKGEKIAI